MFFCFGDSSDTQSTNTESKDENHVPFEEVIPPSLGTIPTNPSDVNKIELESCTLQYLKSQAVEESLRLDGQTILKVIEDGKTDLINGVYEGGFKLWECTIDLLNYLDVTVRSSETPQEVLDLGCGCGLLGAYFLMNGSTVYFQDYNIDVIKHWTIPNIMVNDLPVDQKSRFFAGSWQDLASAMKKEGRKFDVIVTSETIYNPLYYSALIDCIKGLMKEEGVTYLAAKAHYFGVGGNVHQFQEELQKDGTLTSENCFTYEKGLRREVLRIQFKSGRLDKF